MDSIELDQNGSCTHDVPSEQLDSSACNIFGEPEILPRIGDQYQVEIPPLIRESDYALYKKNPAEVENRAGLPFNFLMGLPIPIIWINQEIGAIKHVTTEFLFGDSEISSDRNGPFESQSGKKTNFCLEKENSDVKIEQLDIPADNEATGSANPAFEEKQQQSTCPGYCLVPGSNIDSWNDNEKRSFLLGLYIFEKNFVQLKRFVESKRMGDILTFYYGKFYGSHEYQRWSKCLKTKSKKRACGQKLFIGLRQQEFLSRLLPSVSEECQIALSEVSKTFAGGKMSLEDYVFSLKAMVGTNVLVEAVGIGKRKKDLTCMAVEPLRSNQVIFMRSEIPTGKACGALEASEIIKFLTGDYRLSKARASDLFWEAVWPRLLARGWQSERPKNEGKDSLVFLVPGVKKFSRRRLVKGKQYFDSVTDILSKVASEPALLEFDSGEGKGNKKKEEDEWTPEKKEEQDDMPTRKCHSYLQPRTPSLKTGTMKFTVVDTSLTDGKPYKVRELRSLLLEVSNKMTSASHSESRDESTSEVSSDELDTVNTMLVDQGKTDDASARISMPSGGLPDRKDIDIIDPKRDTYSICPSINGPVSSSSNIKNLYEDKQSRPVIDYHLSQRLEKNNVDYLAPITKRRRRLTACSRPETSNSSMFPMSEPEMPSCCSGSCEFAKDDLSPLASSLGKLSSTTSSQGFQTESIECPPFTDRTLIDLNVPQVPPDFESGIFMTESAEEQDDHTLQKPEDHNAVKIFSDVTTSRQQHEIIQRRHSTRNRPPTAKALEALANGFLTVSSRPRKNKEISSRENFMSRTSQQTAGGAGVIDLSASSMESRIDEGASVVCNSGSSNMFSEFQVLSEGNRQQTAGPQI